MLFYRVIVAGQYKFHDKLYHIIISWFIGLYMLYKPANVAFSKGGCLHVYNLKQYIPLLACLYIQYTSIA